MKPKSSRYPYAVPFVLWSQLATKTVETVLASAQVIGHRAGRMAVAGTTPGPRDQREFALMGREKIDAGAKSARAMTARAMTMTWPCGASAVPPMMRTLAALMSLAASRTPSQLIARQAALAREFGQLAVSMAEVPRLTAKLALRGLKPVHARATANARRLGRR